MNRKNFALTYIVGISAMVILAMPFMYGSKPEFIMTGVFVSAAIGLSIMCISITRRLDNIGKSKLWIVGLFVPLLNLYAAPMIWSYPPDVKENGMDKKGYMLFILVLIVVIAGQFFRLVMSGAN